MATATTAEGVSEMVDNEIAAGILANKWRVTYNKTVS